MIFCFKATAICSILYKIEPDVLSLSGMKRLMILFSAIQGLKINLFWHRGLNPLQLEAVLPRQERRLTCSGFYG